MYMIVEVSQYVAVASFSEAWIEIVTYNTSAHVTLSPPSRRRGLKLYSAFTSNTALASPPSRRRGLK